jgi:glycosyltransferase involved in cell wall biosynthesis
MRILFFTYYSSLYCGADRSLVNLIEGLKNKGHFCSLICLQKGDIYQQKESNIFTLPSQKLPVLNFLNKSISKLFPYTLNEQFILSIHKKLKIDFWFINTTLPTEIFYIAVKHNIPFVTYIHELPTWWIHLKPEYLKNILKSKFILCASRAIKDALDILDYQKTYVIHEILNVKDIEMKENIFFTEKYVKAFENFSFVFGMSGAMDPRKGFDIFAHVVEEYHQKNIAFVWIGKIIKDGFTTYIIEKLKKKQIKNIYFFEPNENEYYHHLNSISCLLLTSREDTYPVVMLEAAYLQKPIIAFDSGGVSEFVKPGMGKVIPLYNFDALFHAIDELMNGKMYIDKTMLRNEAMKHDINHRVNEFENILLEGFYWK